MSDGTLSLCLSVETSSPTHQEWTLPNLKFSRRWKKLLVRSTVQKHIQACETCFFLHPARSKYICHCPHLCNTSVSSTLKSHSIPWCLLYLNTIPLQNRPQFSFRILVDSDLARKHDLPQPLWEPRDHQRKDQTVGSLLGGRLGLTPPVLHCVNNDTDCVNMASAQHPVLKSVPCASRVSNDLVNEQVICT